MPIKKTIKVSSVSLALLSIVIITSCATYYEKSIVFQQNFVEGEIDAANKTLDRYKKAAKGKDRLLYFLQKGVVLQMLGQYEESNNYFENAYTFTEDYKKNVSTEAASFLSNPTIKPYTGEDHEVVLIHYFKALNYLQSNSYDEALVECRRMNNKLNFLNDKYEKRKNRYKRDAFVMNLMGIIYEASGDINNAFIAYRNAYEAYDQDYAAHFSTEIPTQLKKDLLRSAYLNGFTEELRYFEQKLEMRYDHKKREGGELVFFWHNGLGPVKGEWSMNFFIVKGQGGAAMFVNEELGLAIPFPLPSNGQSTGGLGDLKFVRVAFPKYLERKPYYRTAELKSGNYTYQLEMAQNINEIAFKTMEDRMIRELSNSLMRLALKQAAEQQARNRNENLGALVSVINAVSEKADTRNWQTLPYSISYARVPLKAGDNQVKLNAYSPHKSRSTEHTFNFEVQNGQTVFHIFHSLESIPINLDY